ncbi:MULTISPECIES: threonine/serine ThrE exporter family protein [unclassified Arthrobacter]|uniref:threonine/serine ThrE exporter family protein n=1 Tax=unclassified Arthrobacter TaxID=235627 RepID=UPI0002DC002C|nr:MULTISPECIES: threonine/serine exporter family protein [unclassified Arthrobacter]PVE19094.1 threonine/serine exporter family protein [Arthrobacter sp. Bz4]
MGEKTEADDGRNPNTNPAPVAEQLPIVPTAGTPASVAQPAARPVHSLPGTPGGPGYAGRSGSAGKPGRSSGAKPKSRPRPANNKPDRRTYSTPTDALPTTPRSVRPDRSNAAARKVLRRLVQGETPPTQAMSIVERLAGSPYANPTIQVSGPDINARRTLDFALSLAETMFRYGAGALEVETSIIAVTAAFGLDNIEVDITNQSVILNYSAKDQTPVTVLRVVRSWTNNYAGLLKVHQLVTDVVNGGTSRIEAAARLDEITHKPKPFPRWMVTAAFGVFGAAIVSFIGGGPLESLISFASCIGVDLLLRQLGKWRVPEFFSVATASGMVTIIAMFFWWLDIGIAPSFVVVGGILLLLPTGRLVSATQDAINGFPVTAAGRYLSAFLVFAAIISGIAVALVVGALVGVPELALTTEGSMYPLPVAAALVLIAVAMIGVAEQTDMKLLLPTALIGVTGFLLYSLVVSLGVGYRLAPAIAAVLIGMLARMVALRMGAPQLVVAVPAVMFLYPGLMVFRSMYGLTIETELIGAGTNSLFNALTIILAIAGGVVLGDNLARPLTKGVSSNERRNRRR